MAASTSARGATVSTLPRGSCMMTRTSCGGAASNRAPASTARLTTLLAAAWAAVGLSTHVCGQQLIDCSGALILSTCMQDHRRSQGHDRAGQDQNPTRETGQHLTKLATTAQGAARYAK